MKTTAGIDLGTQSVKVMLYDFADRKIVFTTSAPLSLIKNEKGACEQTTDDWERALETCFHAIPLALKNTIVALAVSGQQHGFVPLDKNGVPLYNVKLWCDTETQNECNELTQALGEKTIIDETNNLMLAGYTAPKILWLKKNHPHAFEKLKYIMLPHDYVNFLFDGNYAMESGDASGTALFNPRTKLWSKKICDAIDKNFFSLLPKIISNETVHGFVSAKASARFGIPCSTIVASGGGDNMMSAIGSANVSAEKLTMSLGTSGTLFAYAEKPITNAQTGIAGFCSSNDAYLPLACTMNCTVATETVKKLFSLSTNEFSELAEESDIGAGEIILLPFFSGERFPVLPQGSASFHFLSTANATKANFCKAALEAASFSLYDAFRNFQKLSLAANEITLIGGGAKNLVWQKIIADLTNVPVQTLSIDEAASFGACLQALAVFLKKPIAEIAKTHVAYKKNSSIMPNEIAHKKYERAYKKYQELVSELTKKNERVSK